MVTEACYCCEHRDSCVCSYHKNPGIACCSMDCDTKVSIVLPSDEEAEKND